VAVPDDVEAGACTCEVLEGDEPVFAGELPIE
jgi:hypothetical protein